MNELNGSRQEWLVPSDGYEDTVPGSGHEVQDPAVFSGYDDEQEPDAVTDRSAYMDADPDIFADDGDDGSRDEGETEFAEPEPTWQELPASKSVRHNADGSLDLIPSQHLEYTKDWAPEHEALRSAAANGDPVAARRVEELDNQFNELVRHVDPTPVAVTVPNANTQPIKIDSITPNGIAVTESVNPDKLLRVILAVQDTQLPAEQYDDINDRSLISPAAVYKGILGQQPYEDVSGQYYRLQAIMPDLYDATTRIAACQVDLTERPGELEASRALLTELFRVMRYENFR